MFLLKCRVGQCGAAFLVRSSLIADSLLAAKAESRALRLRTAMTADQSSWRRVRLGSGGEWSWKVLSAASVSSNSFYQLGIFHRWSTAAPKARKKHWSEHCGNHNSCSGLRLGLIDRTEFRGVCLGRDAGRLALLFARAPRSSYNDLFSQACAGACASVPVAARGFGAMLASAKADVAQFRRAPPATHKARGSRAPLRCMPVSSRRLGSKRQSKIRRWRSSNIPETN